MGTKTKPGSSRSIGERRQSETFYRAIAEDQTDMVVRFSADHRITYANPAYCRYRGMTLEELIGSWVYADIAAVDRQEVERHYAALSPDHPVATIEHRATGADGELRWQHWTDRALFDDNGRFIAYQTTGRDITERKAMEQARDESEARHRAVLETALDAIITIDTEGRIAEFNPAAEAMFGYRRAEAIGRKLDETIIPPSLRDAHREGMRRVRLGAPSRIIGQRLEMEAMRRDGQEFPVELAITCVAKAPGNIFIGFLRDITERRQAETAARESQALLRAVIDAVPAMITVKDRTGRYVLVNDYKAKYDGRPIQWYMGKTAADLYTERFARETGAREETVFATGVGTGAYEYDYVDADGQVSHWLGHLAPISDPAGGANHLVSVAIDITERKRMEAALRESQALLRAIIDAVPAAINVKDLDGRYVLVNEYQAKYNKRPIEWYRGKTPSDLYPEQYVRELSARDEQTIASGKASEFFEYSFTDFDGAISNWLGSKVRLSDEGGQAKYILSASIDISDRKRSEAALRQSEQRYRQLVEATGAIPYTWDVDSRRFLFVGPQAAKLLGYPAESWTDEEFWASHLLPADREKLIDLTRRLNEAESEHQDEYWMVAAEGGARWIRDVVTFGRDHQGRRIAFGLMFDETARKQRDEQLAQAQKMEALGQLTGGVAHDFNNMLMVINGNLELLARRIGPEPRVQESLNLARGATRAAADLTNHLLAFARRQVLQPRAVDLATLMPAMGELLFRTLGERIEYRFVLGEGIWPVLADPGQLQSALLNLALNARDAMPGGGRLAITVANLLSEQPETRLLAAADTNQYVIISVSDSGTGMAPKVMARAFEPFFTTKEGGRGSGLGLSMVYGFVRQSGGHISIDSKPGGGTTIEILLPRAEKLSEIDAPEPTVAATRPIGARTILVVEDNARVRTTTVRMLEDLGYQVLEAPDGSAALEMVRDHPEIDLLFSDVVMPGEFDGPALARKARELRPSVKLLFASGVADDEPMPSSQNDLRPVRLSKPYDSDQLARTVRTILDAA